MRLAVIGAVALGCAAALPSLSLAFLPPPRTAAARSAARNVVKRAPPSRSPAGLARGRSVTPVRMGILDGLLQTKDDAVTAATKRTLSAYLPRVERINALEATVEKLSDEELAAEAEKLRQRIKGGASEEDVLDEAFALVREAAWRVLELRHYDVQLMGGLALHEGKLAEMATGEGKTLVATLPSFLSALSGKGGVFVVTANDYLARRDAETMGQVQRFLGLSVGLVQASSSTEERKSAYSCDITYVTNQELGFDFLRDHLAVSPEELVQSKPLYYCIVDEADSILIDEARTPLIISKQVEAPGQKYATAAKISGVLEKGVHYNVNEKDQSVILTDRGYSDCDRILGKTMFDPRDPWANFILNALKAKELLRKDKEYIVKNNQVVLVDAFSGRVLDGRRYSDGLHQSIEAKEGIVVSTQSKVTAQVTYQSLFRLFNRLSGMTGTAATEAIEFASTYDLKTISIPTALPIARRDYPDVVFRTRSASDRAMLAEISRVSKDQRPVLIGTTSIDSSEKIAALLTEEGISCQVLNAKPDNVQRESEVVAQAGRLGAVTVATNMAGRGTDIILGGNSDMMARIYARDAVSRKAKFADEAGAAPPASQDFFPCELSSNAETELEAAVNSVTGSGSRVLTSDQIEDAVALAAGSGPIQTSETSVIPATAVALLRKALSSIKAEFSESLREERKNVLDLGGLYVVGTSRHESRRVDNQLRGRAGRQGDPGATRFFLSLDDEIFRVFGGDRTKKIMETFRISEDMPLESAQVAESLDKVQQATEDYFAGIRRTVLDFDEVLNKQRQELYRRRQAILLGDAESTGTLMRQLCRATVDDILPGYVGKGPGGSLDAAGLSAKIMQFFPTADSQKLQELDSKALSSGALAKHLHEVAEAAWVAKLEELEAKKAGLGWITARYLLLTQYDNLWSDHLEAMNMLRENVSMERFSGNDPLNEFKIQGGELFRGIFDTARLNTVFSFFVYKPTPKKQ